jgi:CHAD domain-containing protein
VAEVAGARERLLATLRTPRYVDLLDRLVDAARQPVLASAAGGSARAVLPPLVARPWSKLRRAVRRLDERSTDEDLHAVRIRAKRCRYAAEAAAPVVGRRAARFARRIAKLQDALGAHHDAVVAAAWLHADPGRRGHEFAAGQLWGLERASADSARRSWPEAWKSARRKRLRSWI